MAPLSVLGQAVQLWASDVCCVVDAETMGEAWFNDNDPHEHHPQQNVLIAIIAIVWQHVSFVSSLLDSVLNRPIQMMKNY